MNRFNQIVALLVLVLATGLSACKKKYDTPPVKDIPVGNVVTLGDLKAMYTGTAIKFTEDYSVFGVVAMDESTGNLYKNIYVQDNEHGINVRLITGGGVYEGDSIRIYLKGVILSQYNGQFQLDSVDVDKNIIKQKTNVAVTPVSVNIADLGTVHHSRLIKIEGVEFQESELGKTYANAIAQTSQNRTIRDCAGNSIIVRTSGYANFANTLVPTGNGSIIAVMSDFNGTKQLYVRRPSEVQFNNLRCDGSTGIIQLVKDFEDGSITSGGWSSFAVSGNVNWVTSTQGSNSGVYYAKATNFSGGVNTACESWLISPSINLSTSNNPALSFINAYNYAGSPIQVYVSTNYTDGDPTAATWTQLTPALSPGSWAWINSGNLSLSAFKVNNVRIGIKYTGSASDGSTWEVDDIIIKEI
jgi:hypothetical protein